MKHPVDWPAIHHEIFDVGWFPVRCVGIKLEVEFVDKVVWDGKPRVHQELCRRRRGETLVVDSLFLRFPDL